jgi:hypothetical protein
MTNGLPVDDNVIDDRLGPLRRHRQEIWEIRVGALGRGVRATGLLRIAGDVAHGGVQLGNREVKTIGRHGAGLVPVFGPGNGPQNAYE